MVILETSPLHGTVGGGECERESSGSFWSLVHVNAVVEVEADIVYRSTGDMCDPRVLLGLSTTPSSLEVC